MKLRHRLLIERLVILLLLAIIIGFAAFRLTEQKKTLEADIAEEYVHIAENVIPAVVAITAADNDSASYGSGMIIQEDGYILTNNHVIANTTQMRVILPSNEIYAATVIGIDAPTDLAVIKINATSLPVVTFGDSDSAKVGEKVLAIGNPFGLESTITSGIISAKNRDRGPTVYRDYIQTDASINPGNSVGPLVNIKGEVIGINTFIYSTYTDPADSSRSITSIGLGFAIPADIAKHVAPLLIGHKNISRGFLGVRIADIIFFDEKHGKGSIIPGANVTSVFEDSPAARAGIKPGDIIKELDTRQITSANQLKNIVGWIPAGTTVTIIIERAEDGKKAEKTVKIILEERPQDVN